jgi:hypothetical protein
MHSSRQFQLIQRGITLEMPNIQSSKDHKLFVYADTIHIKPGTAWDFSSPPFNGSAHVITRRLIADPQHPLIIKFRSANVLKFRLYLRTSYLSAPLKVNIVCADKPGETTHPRFAYTVQPPCSGQSDTHPFLAIQLFCDCAGKPEHRNGIQELGVGAENSFSADPQVAQDYLRTEMRLAVLAELTDPSVAASIRQFLSDLNRLYAPDVFGSTLITERPKAVINPDGSLILPSDSIETLTERIFHLLTMLEAHRKNFESMKSNATTGLQDPMRELRRLQQERKSREEKTNKRKAKLALQMNEFSDKLEQLKVGAIFESGNKFSHSLPQLHADLLERLRLRLESEMANWAKREKAKACLKLVAVFAGECSISFLIVPLIFTLYFVSFTHDNYIAAILSFAGFGMGVATAVHSVAAVTRALEEVLRETNKVFKNAVKIANQMEVMSSFPVLTETVKSVMRSAEPQPNQLLGSLITGALLVDKGERKNTGPANRELDPGRAVAYIDEVSKALVALYD